MTEPELQQGNDNDDVEQSDLSELDSELEREYTHPCIAEFLLADAVSVREEDRVGMTGGVTIMWVGLEAFVQLPRDLRVNREPVTFVTGMRGALLMIINENRQTMHCSHCSNFDSTSVLDNPIAKICDDRDSCRCPCAGSPATSRMNNDDGQWNGPTLLALTCAHVDLRLTDATIKRIIRIKLSDTHLMHVVCSCMCLSLFAFVSCMFALFLHFL